MRSLATRIADIAAHGVPNYFGPQRFGREGANLARMSEDPRALAPEQRSFVLSAARSLVFNAVVAERVADGVVGNLESRGHRQPRWARKRLSRRAGGALVARALPAPGDCIPPAPCGGAALWPRPIASMRSSVPWRRRFSQACALTEQAGMDQERRALRLAVRDLQWQRDQAGILISFRLTRSGFATTVLREIVDYEASNT